MKNEERYGKSSYALIANLNGDAQPKATHEREQLRENFNTQLQTLLPQARTFIQEYQEKPTDFYLDELLKLEDNPFLTWEVVEHLKRELFIACRSAKKYGKMQIFTLAHEDLPDEATSEDTEEAPDNLPQELPPGGCRQRKILRCR